MLVLLICWYSSSVQFVFRTSRETNKKVSSLSISQKWFQLLLMQKVLLPIHEMWNALFTHCSDYLCFYFCSNQNLAYVTTPDIVNNDKSSPFYQVSKIFHLVIGIIYLYLASFVLKKKMLYDLLKLHFSFPLNSRKRNNTTQTCNMQIWHSMTNLGVVNLFSSTILG